MKTEDFAKGIAVVNVDFQGQARIQGTVPEGLAAYLRTEIFPVNAPPSLRNATNYGGIKLFLYQERSVCVGYFHDAGKTDEYQRAVASASVLVFDRTLYQKGFRNLSALRDFLMDAARSSEADSEYVSVLWSLYNEASLNTTQEEFKNFLTRLGVKDALLAAAIGLLSAHKHLLICAPSPQTGQAFLTALFAVAPVALLQSSWCTYASSLSGRYEEIIVHTCQLNEKQANSWLDKMKGRFAADKNIDPAIDTSTGLVQGPARKTVNQRIAERVLLEVTRNKLNLPLDFPQRFAVFSALLEACCQDASVTINAIPQGMTTADSLARIDTFLVEITNTKN